MACTSFNNSKANCKSATHIIGPLWGDPHILTSDGLSYTFNGLGEYLFTKIGENDTVIQARTERVVLDDGSKLSPHYLRFECLLYIECYLVKPFSYLL